VRPDTLEILRTEMQKSRLTSIMHDLHGELLIGDPGAIAAELAGAWAIVMAITGLYLWWPPRSRHCDGLYGSGRHLGVDVVATPASERIGGAAGAGRKASPRPDHDWFNRGLGRVPADAWNFATGCAGGGRFVTSFCAKNRGMAWAHVSVARQRRIFRRIKRL